MNNYKLRQFLEHFKSQFFFKKVLYGGRDASEETRRLLCKNQTDQEQYRWKPNQIINYLVNFFSFYNRLGVAF